MNIEEKMAALKSELAGLKGKLAEHDADALDRANEILNNEMPELEAQMAEAKSFADVIARIGSANADAKAGGEVEAKTLGEFVANSVKSQWHVGETRRIVTGEWGAKSATTQTTPSSVAPWLAEYDRNIVPQPRRQLTIADLLGSETISGSTLKYLVESATVEGGMGYVAEGGAKPQISFGDPTAVTESLYKIAAWYKESDEILEDAAWLASNIENRAIYQLQLFEENALLSGNGSSGAMTGLLNRSGVQTQAYSTTVADTIFKAMTKVRQNSPFRADAIVINPADYEALRLAKDSNNQYYGGGYFAGPYGNGAIAEEPPIWGLRTVVTPAISAGTALIGAFKQGASVFRKGGLRVEMTNSDVDDFEKNLVTVRIEERLGLAVRYPAAFCIATVNPS